VFYPEVGDGSGTDEGGDDGEATNTPGFGLLLGITAVLGAALIATRRE
jgi:PGF-CTERM protein